MEECFSLWFAGQQCEPLIQEMPQAVVSVVRAIDASPVLLERAVGTMTSQDVSIPEIVECVSFSWIYILRSLLFGEITLKDAEILLEIGQRKQLKIAEWLRLELSAARQLGHLEEDVAHCDRQAIESNLTTTLTIHSLFQCPIRHEHRAEDLTETRLASSRWWFETIWGTTPRAEGVAMGLPATCATLNNIRNLMS